MLKTYGITPDRVKSYTIGASNDDFHVRIKAFDGGSTVLDICIDVFDIGGATYILNALGYEYIKNGA